MGYRVWGYKRYPPHLHYPWSPKVTMPPLAPSPLIPSPPPLPSIPHTPHPIPYPPMLTAFIKRPDGTVSNDTSTDALTAALRDPKTTFWLDMCKPTDDVL